jgi:acyl-CoA hydrolase
MYLRIGNKSSRLIAYFHIKPTGKQICLLKNGVMNGKKVADSRTIMTEMVMPNDTNPMGNLMGGNLMKWMDIVAAVCAGKHCAAQVVTVSVDHVSFQKPILKGDIVTLEAVVTRAFHTSVEIFVEVFASDMKGGNPRRCNHAYLTFVALGDETGKPTEVPPVIALSGEETSQYESAARRRELRLILGGKLRPQDATELRNLLDIHD